jgi:glutamyl-tRNA reductase
MVLGETQILGQVREAYDAAREAGSAGAVLHPLFQRAIAVGKQVMTQTTLGEGRLSVASVAVDYARQIFDHFNDKTVLCIGAGKMATLVLQSFSALRPGRLLVCNRSIEKAEGLAGRFGGKAAPMERISEHLVAADIVITSTGASDPIITRSQFEHLLRQRRYRPIFLIDIALPRDVEPAVGEIENVYLYNIDDLQKVVAATQSSRQGAIAAARAIVDQQVTEFLTWSRAREIGPVIDQLYQRYHEVAQAEVMRTINKLPNLSAAEKEVVEHLARRIVNKLLHDPIQTLRSSKGLHGSTPQYLHALERLFKLTEESGADASDVAARSAETANEDAGGQQTKA